MEARFIGNSILFVQLFDQILYATSPPSHMRPPSLIPSHYCMLLNSMCNKLLGAQINMYCQKRQKHQNSTVTAQRQQQAIAASTCAPSKSKASKVMRKGGGRWYFHSSRYSFLQSGSDCKCPRAPLVCSSHICLASSSLPSLIILRTCKEATGCCQPSCSHQQRFQ